MHFVDRVPLTGTRRTTDGYLVGTAPIARTGVQTYLGSELGKPEIPVVQVYRSEDEVFHKDSLSSFAGKPITIGHPKDRVTAENWKDHGVGQIGEEIVRDGQSIKVSFALMDAAAIERVEGGQREFSVGYSAEIEWGDGVTPDGTTYNAKQKNIFVDHLAIVTNARAGKEFRIGDSAETWGAAPITQTTDKETVTMTELLRAVVVDGLSVQTTDQGAQAIDKLQNVIRDEKANTAKIIADHAASIADKERVIGELKVENANLKDAAPKPGDLDKLVRDRAALVATAQKVDTKLVTDGKSDIDIKRAVVAIKHGDEFLKDASDAEVAGMFKIIARDAKPTDRMGIPMSVTDGEADSLRRAAYNESNRQMSDAWKGETK